MGRIFVVDLEGRTYNCKFCKTQLALADEVVSKVLPVWPAYRNLPPLPGFETGKWQCEQAHTEEFGDESYGLALWSKDLDFKMP